MDLCVGPYERKVEGNMSGEEYPIRDILMSDQEREGHQRCKKYWTKIKYAQDPPFSLIFFWPAGCFRSITRVSAQFWGHFSYSCLLAALLRVGCALREDCWWCLLEISRERKANAEKSWGGIPQPLWKARHLEIEFVDETRKRKEKELELWALIKLKVEFCVWRMTQSYIAPCNSNSCILQQQMSVVSSFSEKINKFDEKMAEEIGKFIWEGTHVHSFIWSLSNTLEGLPYY